MSWIESKFPCWIMIILIGNATAGQTWSLRILLVLKVILGHRLWELVPQQTQVNLRGRVHWECVTSWCERCVSLLIDWNFLLEHGNIFKNDNISQKVLTYQTTVQIGSTIIQIVPFPFTQYPPKSRGLSQRLTAFIHIRPGLKPS
jgi:hypothetical protein